jgi:hypothetical protein
VVRLIIERVKSQDYINRMLLHEMRLAIAEVFELLRKMNDRVIK